MPKLKTEKTEPVTAGDLRQGGNARTALFSTVQRVERLTEEIEALTADRSEVYAEAKSAGLDTKIIRQVIRRRKIPKADRDEGDAILELYEETVDKAEAYELRQSEADAE